MLVGIMSDSHGDAEATAKAVRLLEQRGAQRLFHCGDICGEEVLAELAGHECTFVWGNCDHPTAALEKYVVALGLPCPAGPQRCVLAGKHIAVYHGHEPAFRRASQERGLAYIFYGHTHRRSDHRESGCRLINPGALYRADVHTVALLDLKSADLQFLDIDTGDLVTHGLRW
jgi:uncharacterized protein